MGALAQTRTGSAASPARVLIVDDSAVVRTILTRIVAATTCFTVALAVPDVSGARLALAAGGIDLVLLDIAMPERDGLSALPELVAAARGAPVLVLSSSGHDPSIIRRARVLGAAGTMAKPGSGGVGAGAGFTALLAARMTEILRGEPAPVAEVRAFDVVAIGASTGGVPALAELLRAVPPTCTVPILVTQHLPTPFLPYFAAQVALLAARPCDVATDHLRLRRARVVVAPGDAHLRCVRTSDGHALRLSDERAPSGCRPSADPMFASVAETFGSRALAVVLSGMGRDGCEGARAIADSGGKVVIQDRESSVVWGMPGAVARAGVPHAAMLPAAIGAMIAAGGGTL